MENMFFISLRKHCNEKKGKQLVYFDHQDEILFAHAIITSTAHARTAVFLLSYRNMIFNQSVHIYS